MMFEVLVFALTLACGAPEHPILADHEIRQALAGDLPMDREARLEVFGSTHPRLPVGPTTTRPISYRVWVDPMYDQDCFEQMVVDTLSDERSWPGLRHARFYEVPQFWVTLVAPGATCASPDLMTASCAYINNDGTGTIRVNALRWKRGYGHYGLSDERAMVINHEVGHILGFGHYDCSLMGTPEWIPGAGWPKWDTEWDNCDPIVWPSETERSETWAKYAGWLVP